MTPRKKNPPRNTFWGNPWVQLGLLCLVAFLCYLPLLRYPQPRCDDIYYMIGARGIATGQGYSDISRPDHPPLTKYAPLASLTLVPFVGLIGENIYLYRLVSMVFMVLSVPLYYLWLRGRTGHFGAMLICTLFVFNPITFHLLTLQGNAGLNSMIVAAVFLVADRGPERWKGPWGWVVLGILLAASFYAHRSLVVLIASLLTYLAVFRRQWRPALATALGVIVCAFPWIWRSYTLTGYWLSREYEGEIVGRIQADAPTATSGFLEQSMVHIGSNLMLMPLEIGHGLFPWSRGNGGTTWQFLVDIGLFPVVAVLLGVVFALVVVGWWSEWRTQRGVVEWHMPFHVAMLLVFFIQFAYFAFLMPYLYLYLWRGFRVTASKFAGGKDALGRDARGWAWLGFWLLMLPCLGKDLVVYWGRSRVALMTREARWSWVEGVTPAGATVYWNNLDNYSWSCWRWFDSRRLALGVTESEAQHAMDDPKSDVCYLVVPQEGLLAQQLATRGWKRLFAETSNGLPPKAELERMMPSLPVSQQAYIRSLPPVLSLWERP